MLSRVAAFLPKMKEANEQLEYETLNIEEVEEDKPYIQMVSPILIFSSSHLVYFVEYRFNSGRS